MEYEIVEKIDEYRMQIFEILENEILRGGSCKFEDGRISIDFPGVNGGQYILKTICTPLTRNKTRSSEIIHKGKSVEECIALAKNDLNKFHTKNNESKSEK